MWLHYLLFVMLIVSIDASERKLYEQKLSSVDVELISFANTSLVKYFRHDEHVRPVYIVQVKTAVDLEQSHQIYTVHFQVVSTDNNVMYECPVSVYDDPVGHIRALVRSIICISLEQDPQNQKLIGGDIQRNAKKIPYPFLYGTKVPVEHITDDESNDYDKELFNRFQRIHQKLYLDDEEQQKRFIVFKNNLNRIEVLNEQEEGSAIYGITHLSDLNEEEFTQYYLNEHLSFSKHISQSSLSQKDPLEVSPDAFDWRDHDAVTDVKNQGQCGSCWAFSVTGNIEGVWKVKKGDLVSLSEQELVDCDKVDEGCNGGFMTLAYEQIINMSGLMTEQDYKYDGKQHPQCQLDKTKIKVNIEGYLNITSDENEMAEWLANNAPISIGLNANMMQFYFRGVAHPHRIFCNPQGLNHGVLLVGYGTEIKSSKSIPYWIIKNSWGTHWGEKGYYRLYRGDGSCGVNLMCSSAIVN
ncbi:unnamed protein product [Rotaria socialis]|uniref:Cysteine proteinase n=1 Tax=Rotaria socialis TaxID=392032 RepID=A0A818J607_9BILA|nr:unnamed protein product [Rotaria socialis]CAF3377262.1 unnamed protein product [Rotaria socialis]CAF3535116.1 unnamed protein product [Rotaria socialis]CAF3734489.1 unnamed protein product [Rotaria socialis]CAF3792157.1 unnamed protein product [Rotaria socialis]